MGILKLELPFPTGGKAGSDSSASLLSPTPTKPRRLNVIREETNSTESASKSRQHILIPQNQDNALPTRTTHSRGSNFALRTMHAFLPELLPTTPLFPHSQSRNNTLQQNSNSNNPAANLTSNPALPIPIFPLSASLSAPLLQPNSRRRDPRGDPRTIRHRARRIRDRLGRNGKTLRLCGG